MSVSVFDDGRPPPAGAAAGRGALAALRRILLGVVLLAAMTVAVGAWARFELPAAMDAYTVGD